MDGATPGQAFRKVIAPLAAPGIVTAAILVFIFAWNDLLLALSLTATERAITAPVAIANFTGSSQFEEPTGSIAAGAMVITVPIIIFVLDLPTTDRRRVDVRRGEGVARWPKSCWTA